jgi:hypothetical protein
MLIALVCGCGRVHFDRLGDAGTSDAVVSADLIAWYRMDSLEGGGPEWRDLDASGRGHHAACGIATICPLVTPGRVDGGFEFDSGAALHVTHTDAFHTPAGFTVMTWVRIDGVGGSNQCALSKLLGDEFYNSWQLCVRPDSRLLFYSADNVDDDQLISSSPYAHDTWHHVALRWDGTTKHLIVGGQEVGTSTPQIAFDEGDIWIGRDVNSGGPGLLFSGSLDDVRIYNRALATSEIAAIVAAAP